jgi:hypothetical protein
MAKTGEERARGKLYGGLSMVPFSYLDKDG